MNERFREAILRATKAYALEESEQIQSLWSGYGRISRYRLVGIDRNSVVAKQIRYPTESKHPRGWNSDLSHRRKLRSYEVERAWYRRYNQFCDESCRTPEFLVEEVEGDEWLIAMEDLVDAGFTERRSRVGESELLACVRWLANFHATFLGKTPDELWSIGTYWHLDTRPDEFAALEDLELKRNARAIDEKLNGCRFKTFVHGDAKLANFCFTPDGKGVAAVDFQYVGGGCGMKDLAYFVGSCLGEDECEEWESSVLDAYFSYLREGVEKRDHTIDLEALVVEWRSLYRVAWADFHRFLKGWSPGHWKLTTYSERVTREVLDILGE